MNRAAGCLKNRKQIDVAKSLIFSLLADDSSQLLHVTEEVGTDDSAEMTHGKGIAGAEIFVSSN